MMSLKAEKKKTRILGYNNIILQRDYFKDLISGQNEEVTTEIQISNKSMGTQNSYGLYPGRLAERRQPKANDTTSCTQALPILSKETKRLHWFRSLCFKVPVRE